MSASYVIDVTVACLFLLLALRTSDLTCVACLFRLVFLRTNYVICVACLFWLMARLDFPENELCYMCVACLFRLMVLRTSYVTCVPCLFRLTVLRTSNVLCVTCLFWLMARLDFRRLHRNRCVSSGSDGLHRTTSNPPLKVFFTLPVSSYD